MDSTIILFGARGSTVCTFVRLPVLAGVFFFSWARKLVTASRSLPSGEINSPVSLRGETGVLIFTVVANTTFIVGESHLRGGVDNMTQVCGVVSSYLCVAVALLVTNCNPAPENAD